MISIPARSPISPSPKSGRDLSPHDLHSLPERVDSGRLIKTHAEGEMENVAKPERKEDIFRRHIGLSPTRRLARSA
jgi:hypothetical protein